MLRTTSRAVCVVMGLLLSALGCGSTETDSTASAGTGGQSDANGGTTGGGGKAGSASGGATSGGSGGSGLGGAGTGGVVGSGGVAGSGDPACPASGTDYTSTRGQCSGGSACEMLAYGASVTCDCVGGFWAECRFNACPELCITYGAACPFYGTFPEGCVCEAIPPPPNQFAGGCCCTQS